METASVVDTLCSCLNESWDYLTYESKSKNVLHNLHLAIDRHPSLLPPRNCAIMVGHTQNTSHVEVARVLAQINYDHMINTTQAHGHEQNETMIRVIYSDGVSLQLYSGCFVIKLKKPIKFQLSG